MDGAGTPGGAYFRYKPWLAPGIIGPRADKDREFT
jgi:hypothetical protein